MEYLRFLRVHTWPVAMALGSAVIFALDMIGRYQEIMALSGWIWEVAAAALLLAAIILFFYQVHRRIENAIPVDDIGDASENKASLATQISTLPLEARYGDDHDKLLQFVVMALEPACYRLSRLQSHLIEHIDGHPKLKELAKEGILATQAGARFNATLYKFAGFSFSPPETMTLLEMITAIDELEQGVYVNFGRQLQDLEKAAGFNPETDPRMAQDWKDWQESHEKLVTAFNIIKATSAYDTRRYVAGLPSLYRPERPSRWGEPHDFRYDPN